MHEQHCLGWGVLCFEKNLTVTIVADIANSSNPKLHSTIFKEYDLCIKNSLLNKQIKVSISKLVFMFTHFYVTPTEANMIGDIFESRLQCDKYRFFSPNLICCEAVSKKARPKQNVWMSTLF